MKFPKSVHAEGWLDHIETTKPEHMPEALSAHAAAPLRRPVTPLASPAAAYRVDDVQRERIATPTPVAAASGFTVPPSPTVIEPRQYAVTPWVIGAGAGAVLIAVAVMMSRGFAPSVEPMATPPATVVGEVKPSPEDAQLAAEPTAAGPVTATPDTSPAPAEPVVAAAKPAPTPAPVAEAPRVVAAAPTTPPAPRMQAPAPSPALQPLQPVTKTLSPAPEVLAQAAPPVALRDPVTPVPTAPMAVTPPQAQPLTAPPVTTAPDPVAPPSTMPDVTPVPVTPPLAQAQPQPQPQPAAADDAGITVKVRTALATDATLAAVPIAVSTDHGVVKLEGQAPDTQARERATVVAAATQGVKAVDNRLTLPPVALLQQQLEPQQIARAPGN
ncbi:BON domain-containing protein [Roseateles sp.]|uniref:BON domain-containing protein n=1 Tax=Roseateles sp. TaxID=1971397 RepID=UPI003BAB46D7